MYPEKMKQKQTLQEREIEVMRSLRHKNVVELLDVVVRASRDKSGGPYMYLIFEYAKGGDFATYLKRQPGRRLSEAKTRHWMTQLRDGLYFLRQQSILHRDLKPQNLLLSSMDESTAVLKLADFGFARFIHSHAMIETVCGTPLFMAPEILRNEKYEVGSDLWSVGCILYQCLVGHAPFVVSTHYELIKRLEKEDASLPPDVRAQVSPECFDLLMRLLDKNRDTRIGWDAFFRHPWFGTFGSSSGAVGSSEGDFSSSTSSGSRSSMSVGPHFPMHDSMTPASVIQHHEVHGRLHRVADRALAVLELADMKMDHQKREEALVLYRRGLECLADAMAAVKGEQIHEEWAETLIERLKVKQRIYQERAARATPTRRGSMQLAQQQRVPSELMLEFALQMGRDGGVSEILGDFSKAEKLYSNGCVILEQLLAWTRHEDDKLLLQDALQRFVQRIVHVNEMIEREAEADI